MIYKTTKTQWDLFYKECKKWERIFELNGWDIEYLWEKLEDGERGELDILLKGRIITVSFSTESNTSLSKKDVKDVAKHEMIHCLLARITSLGHKRFLSESEVYEAEEEVVYKLEKIICGKTG